jgi:hypothetical protein
MLPEITLLVLAPAEAAAAGMLLAVTAEILTSALRI